MKSLIAAICLAPLFASSALAADLTIQIDDVKTNQGQIMLALYNSAESFLKQPLRAELVLAQLNQNVIEVKNLPAGEYAFAVFHDSNGNGKLDRNPVGMPIEDFAFSNQAQGNMGPPKFDAAKIQLNDGASVVRVSLR